MDPIDRCQNPDEAPACLEPHVERNHNNRGWRVVCDALGREFFHHVERKRDAAPLLSGEGRRRWLAAAAREVVNPWRRPIWCSAPFVSQACGQHEVEPLDRALDQGDHAPQGGWPTCGDPIVWRLGGVCELARARLGWPAERWAESIRDRWTRDAEARGAAWTAARTDLETGALSDDDAAALRATPETVGYLRLRHVDELRRRLYPPTLGELRDFWLGEGARTTCWAPLGW